jgi:hypothetical protein
MIVLGYRTCVPYSVVAHALVGSTQDVGHSTLLSKEVLGR